MSRNSPGSAAVDFRGQAAGGRSHSFGLQHPKGGHYHTLFYAGSIDLPLLASIVDRDQKLRAPCMAHRFTNSCHIFAYASPDCCTPARSTCSVRLVFATARCRRTDSCCPLSSQKEANMLFSCEILFPAAGSAEAALLERGRYLHMYPERYMPTCPPPPPFAML